MAESLNTRVAEFIEDVVDAMELDVDVRLEDQPDHVRVNLEGEDGTVFVRRKGEALDALQHIVNTAFRRDVDAGRRIVVDCLEFRRGKDRELRQMTRFLMDKVRSTGLPQEIGPLNSYARRLVHLEVSSAPDMASESQGDGAVKTVIISLRK
jgi:spoIIIJ-associated protein